MKLIFKVVFSIAFLFSVGLNAQISESRVITFLAENSERYILQDAKINDLIITDNYTSKGVHHVYLKQSFQGRPIYDSYGAIHGKGDQLFFDDKGIIKGLRSWTAESTTFGSFASSFDKLVNTKGYNKNYRIESLKSQDSKQINRYQAQYSIKEVSHSPVTTKEVFYVSKKGSLRSGRIITVDEVSSDDYLEILMDESTGKIINEINYTLYCDFGTDHSEHNHSSTFGKLSETLVDDNASHKIEKKTALAPNQYQVYAYPLESPLNGSQSIVTAPWLLGSASPNGWHTIGPQTYNVTRGNNVDAYLDSDNSNGPSNGDADRADGGVNLEFLVPYDTLTSTTTQANQYGALTNLFYWNNTIHDVWANYGFDEASGNFQEENYGPQGADSDYVNAEAQDGGGTCNANMATPADGGNPRMQMYLCNSRDGDVDNGVVIHEYTHGISNRLTGGPSQAGCLGNQEQMGEGWSDYFAVVMTIEPGDAGTDRRPMGNWLTGKGINGSGIRAYPYTTDMTINPFTYDNIKSQNAPHGVGSVWATMLWDMTWALIDQYGFDADIYDGTGGNNMAMLLVSEGMKLQTCSPGFVDGRDAILQADMIHYGGANQCLIWEVFARRGLGFSASQGSSGNKNDGTEAFDMPPICNLQLTKTADISEGEPGDTITYTLKLKNFTAETKSSLSLTDPLPVNTVFVSASNGGTLQNGRVVYPAFNLAPGDSTFYSFKVKIDPNISPALPDFTDDMENGPGAWNVVNSGSSAFNLSTSDANSGVTSWFANDGSSPGVASLITASENYLSSSSQLIFSHFYDTESNWDGGQVYISTDNGNTWENLGDNMTFNGYNGLIFNSVPGFSGNSGGFITTIVDLSDYEGQICLIMFEMNCDQSVGGNGWFVDDVIINNQQLSIPNTALVIDGTDEIYGSLQTPTKITENSNLLSIQTSVINPDCNGDTNGKAYVTATSGTGNYTYLWSNSSTSDTISNLSAGTYSVTVMDGISTKIADAIIIEPDTLSLNMSSTDAPNGTATVSVTGGTSPYAYLWSNGETSQTISNLIAGSYTVTTTDANGCQKSSLVDVIDPTNCSDNLIILEILMDGYPGDISVFVRDAASNIIFENTDYSGVSSGTLVTEYVCVPDGCYEIEISDSFGDGLCNYGGGNFKIIDANTSQVLYDECDIGSGITFDLCYPLLSYSISTEDPSCVNITDGAIDLTTTGGNPTLAVTYSTGATTEDLLNIGAGVYMVEIRDSVSIFYDTITIYDSKASVYKKVGSTNGSLKFAIENACITDTIRFENSLMNDTIYVNQEIIIDSEKYIKGLGMNELHVSGMGTHRLFHVQPGVSLFLENITLQDGNNLIDGGAILNEGIITVKDVKFYNNYEGSSPKSITNKGKLNFEGNNIIQEN